MQKETQSNNWREPTFSLMQFRGHFFLRRVRLLKAVAMDVVLTVSIFGPFNANPALRKGLLCLKSKTYEIRKFLPHELPPPRKFPGLETPICRAPSTRRKCWGAVAAW
jgi:hypothetical protein